MKKVIKIKDAYEIIIDDTKNLSDKAIKQAAKDALEVIEEIGDEPRLVYPDGKIVEVGDEVRSFRDELAIVTGWQAPAFKGKSGRVNVKWSEDDTMSTSYYPQVFNLSWINLKWDKEELVKDMFEPISSFKSYKYIDKTRGGLDVVKVFEDLRDNRMHVIAYRDFDDSYIICLGYSPEDGTWNQGRYDYNSLEEAEADLKEDYNVKEWKQEVEDVFVEDIPVHAPEEKVNVTYSEKMEKGKNALTYGMIQTAFEKRNLDDGKTFNAYIDAVIESLKDDIKNAEYLVSGELASTRKALLEDYVKIERLVKKAGLEDKLAEMKPLIDELSDKLDLDEWKQPKFNKSMRKQASKELRGKHRWDSLSKGERIAGLFAKEFKGRCGPFGGENPYLNGNKVTLHSQGSDEGWIFNDDGSIDSAQTIDEILETANPDDYGCEDKEELREYLKDFQHFENIEDLLYSGLSWMNLINDTDRLIKGVDKILTGIGDSKIEKKFEPVFLCSKTELNASYNDAKQGKFPEVFEANLEKVRKDMTADYDRINQGRDTYLDDARIVRVLPKIIDLYETALKYADDLEYSDYAHEFAFMLDTIKKGWGLAGE